MKSIFSKIKKELRKGLKGGITAVKHGANVVSVKMNKFSQESKRQYKMLNLNIKIKDQINKLGDIAYDVLNRGKSLNEDKKLKKAFAEIKKLEWQLNKLNTGVKVNPVAQKKVIRNIVKKPSAKKANIQPK